MSPTVTGDSETLWNRSLKKELEDGSLYKAEIHRYEANGIGRREFKIKRFLDEKR